MRADGFRTANRRRQAEAASAACTQVQAALDTLGPAAPELLAAAGRLRLAHPQVSLRELGQLADPPMTKDTVGGRIRRLLDAANRREVARP